MFLQWLNRISDRITWHPTWNSTLHVMKKGRTCAPTRVGGICGTDLFSSGVSYKPNVYFGKTPFGHRLGGNEADIPRVGGERWGDFQGRKGKGVEAVHGFWKRAHTTLFKPPYDQAILQPFILFCLHHVFPKIFSMSSFLCVSLQQGERKRGAHN